MIKWNKTELLKSTRFSNENEYELLIGLEIKIMLIFERWYCQNHNKNHIILLIKIFILNEYYELFLAKENNFNEIV